MVLQNEPLLEESFPESELVAVRAWDLPIRIFNWAFFPVLLLTVLTTGIAGKTHFTLEYILTALLAFRMFWGFFGGELSRFKTMAVPLTDVKQQIEDLHEGVRRPYSLGHSPLTGWAKLAVLGVSALMILTSYVPVMGGVHAALSFFAGLGGLSYLGLLGALSLITEEPIFEPMMSGIKPMPFDQKPRDASAATTGAFGAAGLLSVFLMLLLVNVTDVPRVATSENVEAKVAIRPLGVRTPQIADGRYLVLPGKTTVAFNYGDDFPEALKPSEGMEFVRGFTNDAAMLNAIMPAAGNEGNPEITGDHIMLPMPQ